MAATQNKAVFTCLLTHYSQRTHRDTAGKCTARHTVDVEVRAGGQYGRKALSLDGAGVVAVISQPGVLDWQPSCIHVDRESFIIRLYTQRQSTSQYFNHWRRLHGAIAATPDGQKRASPTGFWLLTMFYNVRWANFAPQRRIQLTINASRRLVHSHWRVKAEMCHCASVTKIAQFQPQRTDNHFFAVNCTMTHLHFTELGKPQQSLDLLGMGQKLMTLSCWRFHQQPCVDSTEGCCCCYEASVA